MEKGAATALARHALQLTLREEQMAFRGLSLALSGSKMHQNQFEEAEIVAEEVLTGGQGPVLLKAYL